MSKPKNAQSNNPKGRGYNRVFINPGLLGLRSDAERRELASRESAQRWQRQRDACMDRVAALCGVGIPDELMSSFTVMFEHFRGVEHTTEVPRIHAAYRKISKWAWPHLMHIGRSTVSIAPMIAIPLTWTVVEIPVGNGEGVVQVTRHADGFSGRIQMSEHGAGFTEIGSLGDDFGVLQVFKGQTFTNASGKARPDWVKFCVIRSENFDGRSFNDAVEEGNAEVVVAALKEMAAVIFEDRAAHKAAVKAARTGYMRALTDEVKKVLSGDAVAVKANVTAKTAGPDPEAMESSTSAAATVIAAATPVDLEQVEKTGGEIVHVEQTSALIVSGDAELSTDAEVLGEVVAPPQSQQQQPAAPAAPVVVSPAKVPEVVVALKKRTWYRIRNLQVERCRAVVKPGPEWKSKKLVVTAEHVAAAMRERAAQRDAENTPEVLAGKAALAEAAQNDAVASAVANDPEAAKVMADIAAETERREAAQLDAAKGVVAATAAATIDAETAAEVAAIKDAEIDQDYDPEHFLEVNASAVPFRVGIHMVEGKEVKVISANGGMRLVASAAGSNNMRIRLGEDVADCQTFGEARERRHALAAK